MRTIYLNCESLLPLVTCDFKGYARVVRLPKSDIPYMVKVSVDKGLVVIVFFHPSYSEKAGETKNISPGIKAEFDGTRLRTLWLQPDIFYQQINEVCEWLEKQTKTNNNESARIYYHLMNNVIMGEADKMFLPAQ